MHASLLKGSDHANLKYQTYRRDNEIRTTGFQVNPNDRFLEVLYLIKAIANARAGISRLQYIETVVP